MTAIVDAYLRDLEASLVGPRRVRDGLLREVADHLEDATEAFARSGLTDDAAQRAAIDEFGRTAQVAPGLQDTIAVLSSRRLGLALVLALLPQPFLWDSGVRLAARIDPSAPPGVADIGWLYAGIEYLGLAGIVTGIVAVLVTGVGSRWWRIDRRFAVVAGGVTVLGLAALLLAVAAALAVRDAVPLLWAVEALLLGGPLAVAMATAHASIRAGSAQPC